MESVGKKSVRQLSVSSSSSRLPRSVVLVARRPARSRPILIAVENFTYASRSIIVTQMRSERNPGPLMSTVRILGTPRTDSPLFVLLRCFYVLIAIIRFLFRGRIVRDWAVNYILFHACCFWNGMISWLIDDIETIEKSERTYLSFDTNINKWCNR